MVISAWLLAAARTGIQAGWGWLVAHISILALVPQDAVVEFALTVVAIGAVTAVLRWLETRQGDGLLSRAARGLAALLMLALSARQPVYAPPDAEVKVDGQRVQ